MSVEETQTPRTRGLGRGLAALMGDLPAAPDLPPPAAATAPSTPGATEVPLDLIRRNAGQPRKDFDPEQLEALADSIRQHGVIQPVLLRPDPEAAGRYILVAGERRWRAAQAAGLHAIPALVRELDELGTLELAIVENLQRADLNPLEEALAYESLRERFARTQDAVAKAVGKSRAHIANMMRLLALPDPVKDMVRDGRISAGHARAILTAPDPTDLAREIVARGLSVRETEKLVSRRAAPPEPASRSRGSRSGAQTEDDADAAALASDLSEALGLDVAIRLSSPTSGALLISYRTLEQLDDVCRRLMSPR